MTAKTPALWSELNNAEQEAVLFAKKNSPFNRNKLPESMTEATVKSLIEKGLFSVNEGDDNLVSLHHFPHTRSDVSVVRTAPTPGTKETPVTAATPAATPAPAAIDPTEVVEPGKQLVITDGRALSVWQGVASTFLPQLTEDLTQEERESRIRDFNRKAFTAQDYIDLAAGETLYEVRENKYWEHYESDFTTEDGSVVTRPFASFDEYAQVELDLKPRKAKYLTSIYEKFVVELQLPGEKLRGMNWSKAKEVIPVINKENADEWLDILQNKSLREIQGMVQAIKKPGGAAPGEGAGNPEKETFRFQLQTEHAAICNKALEIAKGMGEIESSSDAFHLICTDFVGTSVGTGTEAALADLDTIIQNVERAFGVVLKVESVDESRYGAATGAAATPAAS